MTPVLRGRAGKYEDSEDEDEDSDQDRPTSRRHQDDYMSEVSTF